MNSLKYPLFRWRSLITVALMSASLSSCAAVDTSGTRGLTSTAQPYHRALYIQYAELMLREVEEGNVVSARMYDHKARMAAAGEDVAIPALDISDIPDGDLEKLQQSYQALEAQSKSGGKQRHPSEFARAQAMLDCWIEEATQNVDEGDIAACRQAFELAMQILKGRTG